MNDLTAVLVIAGFLVGAWFAMRLSDAFARDINDWIERHER